MQHADNDSADAARPGHPSADVIARLVLAESVGVSAAEHAAACPDCTAEADALRAVADGLHELSRLTPTAVSRVPPPPAVWDRIAAATGVGVAPRPELVGRHTDPGTSPADDRRQPATVSVLPRRRIPVLLAVAAAAAVGALLGGLGTWSATRQAPAPRETVLAQTPLHALTGQQKTAAGSAQVVRAGGFTALDLDVSGLTSGNGFLEVWLIDPTVTKMIPIGVLRGTRATFTLPAGVDLRAYPIIDISVEPLDGNPAHSGDSVLRGTIPS